MVGPTVQDELLANTIAQHFTNLARDIYQANDIGLLVRAEHGLGTHSLDIWRGPDLYMINPANSQLILKHRIDYRIKMIADVKT